MFARRTKGGWGLALPALFLGNPSEKSLSCRVSDRAGCGCTLEKAYECRGCKPGATRGCPVGFRGGPMRVTSASAHTRGCPRDAPGEPTGLCVAVLLLQGKAIPGAGIFLRVSADDPVGQNLHVQGPTWWNRRRGPGRLRDSVRGSCKVRT